MEVSTPKIPGKLHHAQMMHKFPSIFGVDTANNPKNITMTPYHFISRLLNDNYDFDVSVAIDVARFVLSGKVMKWSTCPEVPTLPNENGHYIMKLDDCCQPTYLSLKASSATTVWTMVPGLVFLGVSTVSLNRALDLARVDYFNTPGRWINKSFFAFFSNPLFDMNLAYYVTKCHAV